MVSTGTDIAREKSMSVRIGLPISISIACMGTIANVISISFFLKRKHRNLGDKLIVVVNALDITICMYEVVAMATAALQTDPETSSLSQQSHFAFWTIFEMLIELSGLATTLLSALRTISINWPLYQISKKKVYAFAGLVAAYIVTVKLVMFHPTLKEINIKKSERDEVSVGLVTSFANVGFMITFVIVSSFVSIRALQKTRPKVSGQRCDANDKAVKMVLILGLLFVTFNTIWIVLILAYVNDMKSEDDEDSGVLTIITYITTCINSATNPIVYMTRNEEMNTYLKKKICKVRIQICKTCSSGFERSGVEPNV